jgi:hypothetical protein
MHAIRFSGTGEYPNHDNPKTMQEAPDFSLTLGGPLYQLFRKAYLTGPTLELLRAPRTFYFFRHLAAAPSFVSNWGPVAGRPGLALLARY